MNLDLEKKLAGRSDEIFLQVELANRNAIASAVTDLANAADDAANGRGGDYDAEARRWWRYDRDTLQRLATRIRRWDPE